MRRKITVTLIIIVCFLLQSTLFKALSFASISPNLLIVVCASFGFMRGRKEGIFIGFFLSLIHILFIVDQHAAHEKVMYEKLKKQFEKKEFTSQAISPPIVITLSMREAEVLERFKEQFTKLGFEIEHFGGAEYSICGVPGNLYRLNTRDVLIDMLDELTDGISERATADVILDKIASMSCKAAVKGSCLLYTSRCV